RLVLGQHLVATLNEKYTADRLQDLLNTRDFRRYLVTDQTTGFRRQLSLNDVEQRAGQVAARVADEQSSAVDGEPAARRRPWKELRDAEYSRQIQKHEGTINEILDRHAKEVQELTASLRKAQKATFRTAPAVQAIQFSSGTSEKTALTPIIPHERL